MRTRDRKNKKTVKEGKRELKNEKTVPLDEELLFVKFILYGYFCHLRESRYHALSLFLKKKLISG